MKLPTRLLIFIHPLLMAGQNPNQIPRAREQTFSVIGDGQLELHAYKAFFVVAIRSFDEYQ
jgi:hypothetical protein